MTIDDRVDGTGDTDGLPRWSVADVHDSVDSRSFNDAMERTGADTDRLYYLAGHLDLGQTRAAGWKLRLVDSGLVRLP